MMKRISATAILALGALVAAPASAADDSAIYIGGQGGLGKYKETCENQSGGVCDQTDISWRAFGGYRYNRYWSFEFGWTNMGEARVTSAAGGNMAYHVEGYDLVGLLMAPLTERLSAYGKFGAFRVRTEVESSLPAGQQQSASDSSSGWVGGLGLQYDLGRLGFRAEWQRYWAVGAANTGEDDIDVYSLGVLFRF